MDSFQDGVWLVELAAVADPFLVAEAVATSTGVREQAGQAATETLLDALRSKSMLVLLDNCEHLVEACATLVEQLLRACPGLRILATSREPLRVTGERSWRVPTLPAPDPRQLPQINGLAMYPAVSLFVDRAQAFEPRFTLNETNGKAIAGICARLDGRSRPGGVFEILEEEEIRGLCEHGTFS